MRVRTLQRRAHGPGMLLFIVLALGLATPAAAQPEARAPIVKERPMSNAFTFDIEHEEFDGDTEDWQFAYVEYSHKFPSFGSVILRVSEANRFGAEGTQYEIDMYPKIKKGMYAYINVGVSGSDLFPEHRYGFQVWKSLPKSFEASLGIRYLEFTDSVLIWTGSIGKYKGNYYYVVTPYVVDDEDGTSASAAFEVRRYFGDGSDDKVAFRVSYGNAPELDTGLQLTTRLESWSVSASRDWAVTDHVILGGQIGYRDREFTSRVERQSAFVDLSMKYRF